MFGTIVYRIVSHVGMKDYEPLFAAYHTVSSISGNQTNKLLPTLVGMIRYESCRGLIVGTSRF